MEPITIIYLLVLFPLCSAFLLPLSGKSAAGILFRNLLSLSAAIVPFVCSLALVSPVLSGGAITVSFTLPFNTGALFTADALSIFMAAVSSFISSLIILFSFDYISHYDNQNEYYFMVVLFLGSMMGLALSANLIIMYVFWELTAITSWRLIGFFREKDYVRRADKAFLVTVFGALAMLLGFIMLYQQAGSFDLSAIKESFRAGAVSHIAVALIMAGILAKSATLPFHTWLPDAGVAPSPVTALLHAAVLVKIGVYVFARLFVATIPMPAVWSTIVPVIAAVSALVSAGAALRETDLKRIVAYSTISQIAFIFLGLSTGTMIGVAGGLMYILMHGIAKAGLFLCAGIIEQNTHTKDITKMGGLMKTMPFTAVSFLLCAFSVMGIPPFGGFFSKYMVIAGAVNAKQIAISFVFIAGAFLTILYLFRAFNMIFLKPAVGEPAREASPLMVFTVTVLGALSLGGFLIAAYTGRYIEFTAHFMLGGIR